MKKHLLALCTLLALGILLPTAVWAQSVGEIVGSVSDPSGAVIPNAKVTAIQQGTALTRTAISGSSGTYTIPNLPVGSYDVKAEAGGFKQATTTGITLDVAQHREVNFTLALAGTTQSVEVNAAPPLLNTTSATIGGLVNSQQVSTLPLNGRDITNLVMMQPGVNTEVDSSIAFASQFSSNGNRITTNSSFMDNMDTSDNELGGAQFSNFNLDAIAEFKILQNNYSAEYGRGAGAIVQLVSKSGSNQFHGSLFEFVRNSAFDSRNFFNNGPGSAGDVPPFRRNEFGGTFGGPIKKDRTFFFGQYAGFRQRRGSPLEISVPTAEERQGIVNIPGTDDHWTVPLNSVAQDVASRYPLPNQPTGEYGPRTLATTYMVPIDRDQWSTRIDQRISDKDTLFGRFTWANNHEPVTDPAAAVMSQSFSFGQRNDQRNFGLTETHVFSPTLLNTLRLGWTLTSEYLGEGSTQFTQTTFNDGSIQSWGPDTGIWLLHPATFLYNDAVNWTKGRHSITTGFEFRRVQNNEYGTSVGGPQGYFSFGTGTDLPVAIPSASGENDLATGDASPSPLVSFLVGAPTYYQRTLAFPGFGPAGGGFAPFGVRRSHINGFFQDDIKAANRLTINLGLRYEYNTVPNEVAGRLAGIVNDPNFKGGSLYRQLVLNPQPMYYADYKGWGPRVGLAYKLRDKTVLRGGMAIFSNLPLTQTVDQQAFGFPFASTASRTNPPYSLTPLPVTGLPVLTDLQGNPLPPGGDTHKVPANTPVNMRAVADYFGGPVLVNYTDMNLHNGYTIAGNTTFEQQLPGDVVLNIAYVVNNAVRLYGSEWPNGYTGSLPQFMPYTEANPGLGEFQLTGNDAHSTYNSLQTMARKVSAQHGIQFQVSYTWSKAIDNSSTVFNGPSTVSASIQNDPNCWRCEKAVSGFDFTHRFVANFLYTLPFDKWNSLSSLPHRLTGGWQITSILQAQSGFPFTVNAPFGTAQYGIDTYGGAPYARPDLIQKPTMRTGGGAEEQFFSTDVIGVNPDGSSKGGLGTGHFATPGAITVAGNGTWKTTGNPQDHPGNLGRNTYRTSPWSNFDFSLIKDTRITEGSTVQFRAEFFNLFNQHAFTAPGAVLGSSGFGIAGSTVAAERQIQFGLRFIF